MKTYDIGGVSRSYPSVTLGFFNLLALAAFSSGTTVSLLQPVAPSSSTFGERDASVGVKTPAQSSSGLLTAHSVSDLFDMSVHVQESESGIKMESFVLASVSSYSDSLAIITPTPSAVVSSDGLSASLVSGMETSEMSDLVVVQSTVVVQSVSAFEVSSSLNVSGQSIMRMTLISSIPTGNVSAHETVSIIRVLGNASVMGVSSTTSSVVQMFSIPPTNSSVVRVSTSSPTSSSVQASCPTLVSLSVTAAVDMAVTMEQLARAVTVHYNGVSLDKWQEDDSGINQFRELVFEILNSSCSCGVNRW